MNKQELISAIAENAGLTKKDSGAALDAVIAAITDALKKGDSVRIMGLGTFEVKQRAARMGKNPRTGEEIKIPANVVPAFKPGSELKQAVSKI